MDLELAGHLVSRLEYGHSVGVFSADGLTVRIETTYTLTTSQGVFTYCPDGAVRACGPLDMLRHQVIAAAHVDQDGSLLITAAGALLHVAADADFEAWVVSLRRGRRVVCLPGGDLAVWPA